MNNAVKRRRRPLTLPILIVGLTGLAAIRFAGPLQTGAIFFLLPPLALPVDHGPGVMAPPRHKGGIDLATGLYVRENDDLVVPGTPPLRLRRTYRTRDHEKRPFGIGAMHPGEMWLHPEDQRLQRASLILADGARIRFDRVSSGTSYANAMFEHRHTPTEFRGARLGWTGFNWALRRSDGSLMVFQACGPGIAKACSIVGDRDADGHLVRFRRGDAGWLTRIESGSRWISLEYDGDDRIIRATDSTGRKVRYQYDARSRLVNATTGEGWVYRYSYTDNHELATIDEPGATIENYYDKNGLCIRQVNRFPDTAVPYVYDFTYRLERNHIVATDLRRSDGTWERVTFGADGYRTAETFGDSDDEIELVYERHLPSQVIRSLAVTCAGRSGKRLTHSSLVRDQGVESLKVDLLRTHCRRSWRRRDRAEIAN